jgi:arylsulfatase
MNKLAVLVLMAAATQAVAQQPPKPNVVFILADNVGYGDLGSYGGGELRGVPTPRPDALAQEGLRLTQFLVEPACTPSRAALMTGQYSIRNGLSLIAIEGSPYTLPANAFTMGELFKSVVAMTNTMARPAITVARLRVIAASHRIRLAPVGRC